MTNKVKIFITVIIILVVCVLLFPKKFHVNDGGSYGYHSFLYEITFWRAGKDLYPDAQNGVSLHIFPCFDFHWDDR